MPIWLDGAIFNTSVSTGTLSLAQFTANASGTAQDASHRVIYEIYTGKLFYDGNGNAAAGPTQFAVLDVGLALSSANFFITCD